MTVDPKDPQCAAEWMAAQMETPDDPDQLARFEAWRARDPANAAAWREMTRAYAALGHVAPAHADRWVGRGPGHPPKDPAARPVGGTAPPHHARSAHPRAAPRRSRMRRVVRAGVGATVAAACLILAVVAAMPPGTPSGADHATARGEITRVTLADGSTLRLAPESAVSVAYDDARRTVRLLAGTAFFEVTRDPARPFLVATGSLEARVLGTAFEVRRAAENATVAVREGTVGVADRSPQPAPDVTLGPGQWVRRGSDGTIARGDGPPDQVAAWTDGRVVAKDRPVGAVVDEIAAYYSGTVLMPGDALAAEPVTGVFDLDDPARALAAVAAAQNATLIDLSPVAIVIVGH